MNTTPTVIRPPIRLGVHLTREDAERLRDLAEANGCSISEIVRRLIAEDKEAKEAFAERVTKAQKGQWHGNG